MASTSTNNSPSIINAIMDMDLNDNVAVKNVMDVIINHPYSASFFLGSLLGTSEHRNATLSKSIFFYHDAWTPDDLFAFIFGIEGGPHFLVNIFEPIPHPRHGMPFSQWAKRINGEIVKKEDIFVPPVQYRDIEEFVRIDVFNENFIMRNFITSAEVRKADGRFFNVGNIDIDEIIMSLHRRVEGYRIVDRLTNFNDDWDHAYSEDEFAFNDVPYIDPNDTFENKMLNYIYELQKNIKHVGDLSTFAKGMLPGLKVYHPYEDRTAQHIVGVHSPVDDNLFLIAFDRISKETLLEQKLGVKANMLNLLFHYIPDCISNTNQRNVNLLAITYNVTVFAEFYSIDPIISLMHSSESKVIKNAVEFYKNNITLMQRCRLVILKNMRLLQKHVSELPGPLRNFINSPESSELINYCMNV